MSRETRPSDSSDEQPKAGRIRAGRDASGGVVAKALALALVATSTSLIGLLGESDAPRLSTALFIVGIGGGAVATALTVWFSRGAALRVVLSDVRHGRRSETTIDLLARIAAEDADEVLRAARVRARLEVLGHADLRAGTDAKLRAEITRVTLAEADQLLSKLVASGHQAEAEGLATAIGTAEARLRWAHGGDD